MDDHIIDLLRDLASDLEDPDLCWSPLSEIADLGHEAIPSLVQALRHDELQIRRMAAYAFGLLGWPNERRLDLKAAIPHLQYSLRTDSDPVVRRQAAEALWHISQHETALQAFLGGLCDEDVELRRWGAMILGLVGEKAPKAIHPLTDTLDDADLLVRRYAADALAMHGAVAASALPKLETLLKEDEWTRIIGIQAILKIDPSRTEELFAVLAQALESRSRLIRRHAVEAIRELPDAGRMAIMKLIHLLDDEDEAVRMAVLDALENVGSVAAPAVPRLIQILRGEGPDGDDLLVRGAATDVLASIGEEAHEAAYFLKECLDEEGGGNTLNYFHLQIAHALWHVSGKPDELLTRAVELLGDANWWLRYRAAVVLGDLDAAGSAAIPHLRRALKDEHPSVRRSAAQSLAKIDPLEPDVPRG